MIIDLFTVFGRVTLKGELYESHYAQRNGRVWNASMTLITENYSSLALPYKEIEILRILKDRLEKLVVHYRFKLAELSNLSNYKLSGPEFEDSMIQSGGNVSHEKT